MQPLSGSGSQIDTTDPFLTASDPYSRFGYALAALDINRDGVDDLIVSAPAHGQGGATDIGDYYPKSYNGRVYVYLGNKDTGIQKSAQPDFEIRSRSEDDVFYNLGQQLRASDCDGDGDLDLIVLSPLSQ
jgi:glycosylphosphatidylinositol phospholipase D